MQHTDAVKAVLKRANLSERSGLTADQLARAEVAADSKLKASGPRLANFIMKGGKGAGAGKVPGKMSMTEAAKVILGRAKSPLHAHEVYKRALRSKLIATEGATPEQTMAARLAVGATKGTFERTAPNTFTMPGEPKKAKAKGQVAVGATAS